MRGPVILPRSRSIRMYGLEKIDVVRPTKAVSATRNTLSGSTKKSLSSAKNGPCATVCAASSMAAAKVRELNPTLRFGAKWCCPPSARHPPATSGMPRTSSRTQALVIFEFFEVANVQTIELLANLEHEDAQDQDAHQHVQPDAELDDHRHAIGGGGGGKEQSVFHRQEADHLRYRLRARNHHHERQQHTGERNAKRAARDRRGELADRRRHVERDNHEHNAHQQGCRNIEQWLDVRLHVQTLYQPIKYPGNQAHLEQQGQRSGNIQVYIGRDKSQYQIG